MKPGAITLTAAALAFAPNLTVGAAEKTNATALGSAVLLYAPFDDALAAAVAAGDPVLYTAETGDRKQARPGLPGDDLVVQAKEGGKHGGALRFTKKMKPVVFFRGGKNLGYQAKDWTGSLSVWLKLDPDKDLEPGYCDPLQFVAQGWGEGNMFIEFSKDHTPRHFRYAMLPVTKHWNPTNAGWETIARRPMVAVEKPPFRADQWTHVAFSFGNVNSGKKDGWGKLYLNGEPQGEFSGWDAVFNWDDSQSALTLGLSYIGMLDELAVFNRPLTDAEVKDINQSPAGLGRILK